MGDGGSVSNMFDHFLWYDCQLFTDMETQAA